jgi:alanyl-tRNA synthetase
MLMSCRVLLQVDAAGFERAMEEAREKSRAAGKKSGVSQQLERQ